MANRANKAKRVKIVHVKAARVQQCKHAAWRTRENYPFDVIAGCHTGVTQDYRRCTACLIVQQAAHGGEFATHKYTPSQVARVNEIV